MASLNWSLVVGCMKYLGAGAARHELARQGYLVVEASVLRKALDGDDDALLAILNEGNPKRS